MILISEGIIFVNGRQTDNPELIGFAMLDFAEETKNDLFKVCLKNEDVFVNRIKKQT